MRLRIVLLTIALLSAACTGNRSEQTTSTTTAAAPPPTGVDDSAASTSAPAPSRDEIIATTCQALARDRFANRAQAVAAASAQVGAGLRQALATNCPDVFTEFVTLERLATQAATVNEAMAVECRSGGREVAVTNGNDFTVDAGLMVQVGSAESGLSGGTVRVTMGLVPGESRVLDVDPTEVGTDTGAPGCLASVTAWSAGTGPTASLFDAGDPILDPGGRSLPQTRTNDPAAVLAELVRFEVSLFDDPDGAYVEEFEDVRSPNFLRLITDFDERAATGERVVFGGGDALDVQLLDRPRDDLMLLGWTSTPSTLTIYDADGTEVGTTSHGTRVRRGIFLRSPVDGRWRWVHSAFTVIEETDSPFDDDDAITAGGKLPRTGPTLATAG